MPPGDKAPPLVCSLCGGGLDIEMKDVGLTYQPWQVVDYIYCTECYTEWEADGGPRES